METNDMYWLAGLLEGEGCFRVKGGSSIIIQLWMTDKDVVERAHKLMEVDSCITHLKRVGRKDAYFFQCTGKKAKDTMDAILPLMGARRQGKIKECLLAYKPNNNMRHDFGFRKKDNPRLYKRLIRAAHKEMVNVTVN